MLVTTLRAVVYCVLCIVYLSANLYSHLKKQVVCLGVVAYCVLRIAYWELSFEWDHVLRIAYCVLGAQF